MRLLDTNTRYFDQNTFEIPKMINSWGCMVDLLDTVLVNGSNTQEILSVSISEEDLYWIFNLTLNTGHGFKTNLSVVKISDSSSEELNGTHRVQETTKNSINIAILKSKNPLKPSEIPSSLGATISTASLEYLIEHQEPQKRVYRPNPSTGKVCYLRVDNSCPVDYDPSWAKFSRISMFSEIDSMDDFRFRIGRLKAPCWEDNYDAVEDNRTDVWMATRSSAPPHSFPVNDTGNIRTVGDFFIIGDSKTFYIVIRDMLYQNRNLLGDAIYTFGEYFKYMYKEDSLPYLLLTTVKYNNNEYMSHIQKYHIVHDTTSARYLFNTDFNFNFTSQTHQNWAFWLNDNFRSGANTRISFRQFKNELAYNLFPKNIKTHREGATLMEGCMRGLFDFMCNLQDMPDFAPNYGDVISADTFYLTTTANAYNVQGTKYAFKLADWE